MRIKNLKDAPDWLKAAKTEGEDVEILDGRVIWHTGIWHTGTWHGGDWRGGAWYDGTWHGGDWHDGAWNNGNWRGGNWHKGVWLGGNFLGHEVLTSGLCLVKRPNDNERPCSYVITADAIMVSAGCFYGTVDELEGRAKSEGKPHYIDFCNNLRNLQKGLTR